jgi:hypothetical protein
LEGDSKNFEAEKGEKGKVIDRGREEGVGSFLFLTPRISLFTSYFLLSEKNIYA